MRAETPSDFPGLSTEPFRRTEVLWNFLYRAKDFFDAHLALDPDTLTASTLSSTLGAGYVVLNTARLLLGDVSADWDPALARQNLEFADILQRMAEMYEEADRAAMETGQRRRVLDDGNSTFLKYSFKIRWIRQWFLSKIPQEQQQLPTSTSIPTPPLVDPTGSALEHLDNFQPDESLWLALMSSNGLHERDMSGDALYSEGMA